MGIFDNAKGIFAYKSRKVLVQICIELLIKNKFKNDKF